ncbi:unnamed protein product [Penicillium roqueforti FM164]|uniref:Genomic scaffold, ProqFM164S01 n=1 Tax=Penicillium roqueforti (strain FM164) TaxID=1365484 RepID=W6PSG0_PENRF|nr:unnamed protein product [Penicillium roqueforti FM164]
MQLLLVNGSYWLLLNVDKEDNSGTIERVLSLFLK